VNASWTPLDHDVADFLDEFDERGADPGGGSEELFASHFLAVDPSHAVSLTPEQLAATLPARREMFAAAGVGAVRRRDARQLRLDDRHLLVAGRWAAARAGGELELSSTLLVRSESGGYRVLVYLNHRDVAELLASPDAGPRSAS
jgi:hypothetical protein